LTQGVDSLLDGFELPGEEYGNALSTCCYACSVLLKQPINAHFNVFD
jgi:hypothetical protein